LKPGLTFCGENAMRLKGKLIKKIKER
jgi:hypothetical protein